MDVVLLCLAILALAAYVAAPLYRGSASAPPTPGDTAVGAERDAREAALSDLEVDRASGLLDDAGYAAERRALGEGGSPGD